MLVLSTRFSIRKKKTRYVMSAFGLGTVLSPLIKQKGVFKSWPLKEQFFFVFY